MSVLEDNAGVRWRTLGWRRSFDAEEVTNSCEAADWFAKARVVLEEQGARPLRAIADLDEAVMHLRRNTHGDREQARPLLNAATTQFRMLGMTGWLRRAESLGL